MKKQSKRKPDPRMIGPAGETLLNHLRLIRTVNFVQQLVAANRFAHESQRLSRIMEFAKKHKIAISRFQDSYTLYLPKKMTVQKKKSLAKEFIKVLEG